MQRLTKRNIKVINHDTGQQIDFPTFGKQAGEDAYNEVSNQLAVLQAQFDNAVASVSEETELADIRIRADGEVE